MRRCFQPFGEGGNPFTKGFGGGGPLNLGAEPQ